MADEQPDVVELHLDPACLGELDSVGRATDRDRRGVLQDALDIYLDLHRKEVARIEEGLRQARAGEFASDDEVARAFRRNV